MPTKQELLKQYFKLVEDPFDPDTDPKSNPPYSFTGRRLLQPLKIHRHHRLAQFFAKLGSFEKACADVEQFINRYDGAGTPPAITIFGPKHGGLESMADYIAWLLLTKSSSSARLAELNLIDDSYFSLLTQIDVLIRAHVEVCGIKGCDPLFNIADKKDPSEAILTQLFTMLAEPLESSPWLVVLLRPVTYRRVQLVEKSLELLSRIRIAPIFMTSDPDAGTWFKEWKAGGILNVHIRPMNPAEALHLIRERLAYFRAESLPGFPPEFPYVPVEFQKLFLEGDQPIGLVLDFCHGSLNEKLLEIGKTGLDNNGSPAVDWSTMSAYYNHKLQEVATKTNI